MSQDYIEISERTVSEAITAACQKLAVPSERLEYEVIDPGKTGFLGIGSRAAKIRARVKKGMGEFAEIDTSAIISDVMSGKNTSAKKEKAPKKASEGPSSSEKSGKEASFKDKEKPEKTERPEKAEKPEKTEKSEKTEKAERPEKIEKAERPERTEKADRSVKFEKKDRKDFFEKKGFHRENPGREELNKEGSQGLVQESYNETEGEEGFPRRRNRGKRDFFEKGSREKGRGGRRPRRFEREGFEDFRAGREDIQNTAPRQGFVPKKRNTAPSLTDEQIEEIRKNAKTFLMDVFAAMDLDAEVDSTYDRENGILVLDMKGDNMGVLIGKRGQTLDSLQYLVSIVVNKGVEGYIHVKADTENYRERRKKTLENLAKNIAAKVKRNRESVALEPMNPYERRIIHSALQGDRYVTTYSEGEEPYRKVIVTMKEDK